MDRGISLGSGYIPGSEPSPRIAHQNMLTICNQIRCNCELMKDRVSFMMWLFPQTLSCLPLVHKLMPLIEPMSGHTTKSNQITFIVTSPQHKCLGEWNSYERAPDSAEKQQTIYLWTDSAKKTTDNLHMDRQCKKNCTGAFTVLQTVQKKTQQQQFTYGQTVQKNNSNLHMDSTYLQTVQKTMCKIHIHILSTHSVL